MDQERDKKQIRMIASMLMAVGMVAASELSGERELLFPEIVALLTGAWAAKKQPWVVSRKQLVLLMSASAIMGIYFVRYLSCPLLIKVVLAYIITGIVLIICKCSLAPMISACILPILMGTTSIIYPVSVSVMAMIIAVGQAGMEACNLREPSKQEIVIQDRRKQLWQWGFQTVAVGIIAALPIYSGAVYCIAPPLLVLFTEFCNTESGVRKAPVSIGVVTCLCAISGALARYLICVLGGLPLTLAATAAILLVFAIFTVSGKLFPPAGALAFLAFLIPEAKLFWYPIQVLIGTVVLIVTAINLVARDEVKEAGPSVAIHESVRIQ